MDYALQHPLVGHDSTVVIGSTYWRPHEEGSLSLGAHIITPRLGYWHHGIYVGDGKVVHYAGLSRAFHRGPVEEITVDRFTAGRPLLVRQDCQHKFSCQVAVQRARSRVGESKYRILTNNCEHFCNWCLNNEHHSDQADRLLAWRGALSRMVLRAVGALLDPTGHLSHPALYQAGALQTAIATPAYSEADAAALHA
jgi:Lecithin retinol acyltransferase